MNDSTHDSAAERQSKINSCPQIKILFPPDEKNPFIVIDKPAGLPSAPLNENDDSALTQALSLFPQIRNVKGRKDIEYGLLHRIDTATRGLLVIAATQEAYDRLLNTQKSGDFRKWYRAETTYCAALSNQMEGFPTVPSHIRQTIDSFIKNQKLPSVSFTIESMFRPFGENNIAVRPVTEEAGKAALKKCSPTKYTTSVTLKRTPEQNAVSNSNSVTFYAEADCSITAGYRHQVRSHLAWICFPILGDILYNPECKNETLSSLQFTAYKISFPHPLTGVQIEFHL